MCDLDENVSAKVLSPRLPGGQNWFKRALYFAFHLHVIEVACNSK